MTLRKPFLPASLRTIVPEPLLASLREDIICDRLFVTGLSYFGSDTPATYPKHIEQSDTILVYMRQGRGSLTAYGNYKRFSAGQYFVIPAGEEYSFTPSKGESCELIAVRFRGTLSGDVARRSLHHAVTLVGAERRELEHVLLQLFNCFDRGFSINSMRHASCMLTYALANLFYGHSSDGEEQVSATSSNDVVVEVATKFMREHLERRLKLEDIAAHAGYTPTYFSSLFRRKTGYSPITYFNIMKMQRACELLVTTRLRILDICAQLGIEDNYYFSRLFTKVIGMSPKQYRKQHTMPTV
ncbi:MAG: AraC family transcriptional regulator [Bacteroidaceae bacterium]|nr:AraC family transcriptional regulator [Bacteroidaceae bacterium]